MDRSDASELAPDPLTWLQGWYTGRCDGDREHSWGVSIETLDNPGWFVRIDLSDTDLVNRPFERHELHRSEHDWCDCWVEERQFRAACGPANLSEVVVGFRRWCQDV